MSRDTSPPRVHSITGAFDFCIFDSSPVYRSRASLLFPVGYGAPRRDDGRVDVPSGAVPGVRRNQLASAIKDFNKFRQIRSAVHPNVVTNVHSYVFIRIADTTQARACRRLSSEFTRCFCTFSPSEFFGRPSLSLPPPFPSIPGRLAGEKSRSSKTDRVFENVVACLATRPQLPNGDPRRTTNGGGGGGGGDDTGRPSVGSGRLRSGVSRIGGTPLPRACVIAEPAGESPQPNRMPPRIALRNSCETKGRQGTVPAGDCYKLAAFLYEALGSEPILPFGRPGNAMLRIFGK